MNIIEKIKEIILKIVLCVIALFVFVLAISPLHLYLSSKDIIYKSSENIYPSKIGIVFGAAVLPSRKPSDVLKDRLDSAYELYELGKIEMIIVSGDNRVKRYNEPQVMYEYLVGKGVTEENIIRDYAGLRTYDTCIRAKTLWNVNDAVLITQEYHLYRAIYTCNSVGVKSIGYSSTKQTYLNETYFYLREVLAWYKAMFDIHVISPQYIGGDFEEDLSNE